MNIVWDVAIRFSHVHEVLTISVSGIPYPNPNPIPYPIAIFTYLHSRKCCSVSNYFRLPANAFYHIPRSDEAAPAIYTSSAPHPSILDINQVLASISCCLVKATYVYEIEDQFPSFNFIYKRFCIVSAPAGSECQFFRCKRNIRAAFSDTDRQNTVTQSWAPDILRRPNSAQSAAVSLAFLLLIKPD